MHHPPHAARYPLAALALALALPLACGDDDAAPASPATGGATTTTSAGGAGGSGATGGGGAPNCSDDPSLCQDPTPVCDSGACVQCTAADDAACSGQTPWCNPSTNSCEACGYHSHCPDSACNPFTGACLAATPETVGPAGDYPSITAALASVADGSEAVFLVSPNTSMAPYSEDLQLGGTRVVALLAAGGRPALAGISFPTFTVANGATLLLEGVDLRSNSNAVGLQAAGLVALDRVLVAQNAGGGIQASSSAELLVRSSIVAGNGFSETAIVLGQGTLELVSSSVGGTAAPSAAISCNSGHQLTIRNSILFNRHTGATLETCTSATISRSAGDETLTGSDNTTFSVAAALFVNLNNGDLRLTAAGKTEFDAEAVWLAGDPPADIDGAARPTTDGSADVAGAHLGP